MNDETLSVRFNCRNNEQCYFEGKDIFLDIKIFNNSEAEIGFPLEFVKSKGPIMHLIDNRTKADTFLPTHPPDGKLLEKFVMLRPGEFAEMEWVVTADELREFGNDVDVSLELTIMADVTVKGKKIKFKGSSARRIVDKPRNVS